MGSRCISYKIEDLNSHIIFEVFLKRLGTKGKLSTTFHPQLEGQSEHTIQTLYVMLKTCVIDFKGNWDNQLPLIEFSYNNNYHSSIATTPCE